MNNYNSNFWIYTTRNNNNVTMMNMNKNMNKTVDDPTARMRTAITA